MIDPSQLEFYIAKSARLESDLVSTQEQLMNVRLRLRTMQDFQIKYQLIYKELEKQKHVNQMFKRDQELKFGDLIKQKIDERDKHWEQKVTQLEREIQAHYQNKISRLKDQVNMSKLQSDRGERGQTDRGHSDRGQVSDRGSKINDNDLLNFKIKKLQKENERLQQKIFQMKIDYEKMQEQEIDKVKKNMDNKNKSVLENQRKIYREKIQELEIKIQNIVKQLQTANQKINPQREQAISKLQTRIKDMSEQSNIQLKKLAQHFEERNTHYSKLLEEREKIYNQLTEQRNQQRQYIKNLQIKIFEKQKQHEQQLLNLQCRMKKIREDQIQVIKIQIARSDQQFQQQRKTWDAVLIDKDKELQRITKKAQQDKDRHKQDRTKQKQKIAELQQRLKGYQENREAVDLQNMLKSLKDLDAKDADFSSYENSVVFLNRQLKKSLIKIEQKNIEVSNLVGELNELREQNQREHAMMKQQYKKDRQHYIDKIHILENQLKEVGQNARAKQKQFKRKMKQNQAFVVQAKAQNKSSKQLIEQMKKDYDRMLQNKKNAQNNFREQRQKSFTSQTDLTMAKRNKWLELQRQKKQLEVIFKERQEQLKNKFQVEKQRLRNQRDKLKQENEMNKQILQSQKKDQKPDSQNKQNVYVQYEKKIATLDLQIALTKNIYDSLRQAKSRRINSEQEEDALNISSHMSQGQEKHLLQSSHKKDQTNNMLFSFQPQRS